MDFIKINQEILIFIYLKKYVEIKKNVQMDWIDMVYAVIYMIIVKLKSKQDIVIIPLMVGINKCLYYN